MRSWSVTHQFNLFRRTSYHRQQNDLPKLKESWTDLKNVHSQVLQTTIRSLHDTWEAFTVPVENRGTETARASVLLGSEMARKVPKSRKGKTRKSKK